MAHVQALMLRLRRTLVFQWRLAKFRYYGFLILWHCAEYDWQTFGEILELGYPVDEVRLALNILCEMDLMEARMNMRDIHAYPPEVEADVRRALARIPVSEAMEELLEYRVVDRPPAPDEASELRALSALHA